MKKLNQRGFAHLAALFVVVAVIGVAGFAGYRVYRSKQINAHASSYKWTDLGLGSNGCGTHYATVCVCKEAIGSTSWKISAKGVANASPSQGKNLVVMSWQVNYGGAKILSGQTTTTSNVHFKTVARNPKANVTGSVGWGQQGASLQTIPISSIVNCF